MSSQTMCDFKIPGEHVVDGVTLAAFPSKDTIKKMKEGNVPHFDLLVATPQRAGTARLLEIVWLLSHNCDYKTADVFDLASRHLFLDLWHPEVPPPGYKPTGLETPPLMAKTHLPPSFVKEILRGKKVIVGFRNPKDNLVSQFHFYKMNQGYGLFPGTWNEFFDIYMQGRLAYGCPMDMMLEWWKLKDQDNVLIVKYEDFEKKGAHHMVKLISDFLGYDHDAETLKAVVDRVSFNTMKGNPMTNYAAHSILRQDISPYMRKGAVGDWKNYFNEEQSTFIDTKYSTKCVPNGLTFDFD